MGLQSLIDLDLLSRFKTKILALIPTKTSDIQNDSNFIDSTDDAYRASSIPMGVVDDTSTATAFTATVAGITELRDGVCCYLKNGVITSAKNCTLNINNLGAKPLYSSLAAASRSTTVFNINYTMLFIYNSTRVSGGCWDVFYGYDTNTNTIGYQLRTNSLSLPMSEITYQYRLLFTSADGTKFVPANTSSSTNATAARNVNQTPIDPHGRIVYYGTTASVAADSRPSVSYLWTQYVVTLGYSFNRTGAALTLTSWKPVYIKCAPQRNGSAIIDEDTPFVQDLPNTVDGKIYIFLGIAVSATTVEVTQEHPVYQYKMRSLYGAIEIYTGPDVTAEDLGAYVMPQTGIPKTDLAEEVADSLVTVFDFLADANGNIIDGPDSEDVLEALPGSIARVSYTNSGEITYLTLIDNIGDFSYTGGDINVMLAPSGDSWELVYSDLSEKLDTNQGVANAGKFLVVGNDGYVTSVTMQAWQGGTYGGS